MCRKMQKWCSRVSSESHFPLVWRGLRVDLDVEARVVWKVNLEKLLCREEESSCRADSGSEFAVLLQ